MIAKQMGLGYTFDLVKVLAEMDDLIKTDL